MRIPPWSADALLGIAVTGTLAAVISARQGGDVAPGPIAYAWAVGLGALMLARRHHPRAVLLTSAFGLCAYYAVGYPAVGVGVPLAAALFSAAEAGFLRWSVLTAAGVLGLSLMFRLLEGQSAAFVVGYDLITHVTLMAAAIALGDGLRSRRAQRELQLRENLSRVREERLAIARDLHDSVGHGVSVISLHVDVAREAVPPGNEALDEALLRIRQAADRTMSDLRGAVGVLRGAVSLDDLSPVLDPARTAGFDVSVRVAPEARELPELVDAAAYRIVQEAVTNVLRHASSASRVSVSATVSAGLLHLTISDDGPPDRNPPRERYSGHEPADNGAPAPGSGMATAGSNTTGADNGATAAGSGMGGTGHGLAGMAERARALGGALRTRHGAEGFTVEAELPLVRTA
ncbi:sensor histidine kinase [Catenuloplanes atrovinosus]|uniref:histidine kinase n=1 Tax=Catenuloplanes atrovinosus TaxID=137266 RepID=A0AAE3YGT4_9ACTN|nr:histidine kinase [Catenuloplanes atrovinosus]MDR7273638.1 signal transduction histidine kinase [Catenuloplanes atrovinosus]